MRVWVWLSVWFIVGEFGFPLGLVLLEPPGRLGFDSPFHVARVGATNKTVSWAQGSTPRAESWASDVVPPCVRLVFCQF